MNLDPATKSIGQLALELPNAINVMEKWKIDYCCHGNRSVAQACADAGIGIEELFEAIGERPLSTAMSWSCEPLAALQTFIVETHHAFTRQALETVVLLSDKVASRHGANHPETVRVAALVKELTSDLIPHMQKEEGILFPYVAALESAAFSGSEPPASCFGTVRNPIRMMMNEHEAAADTLGALRAVTRDYALPDDACLSFRALYERLAELEQDLHRHIHLENNILFPRAAAMEESTRRVTA
ncbi:MAG TPA: iron-sulfur cluster repair di-iron protein [Thermoanaerobaculia bacterium]|nr:iron-sulfur cluster repair di-iron protein [Thermoanaerobaculia bacterium]